jgi:stress response protein YsnF
MDEKDKDLVVPIIREEVHADAVPVVTGGVRVTKRVENHDEVVEQELRKSRVEVKRVKTDRVVDGPQPVQRVGNTLIVPVVSEVLRIEKQWVVTEEIHITELQERETVQNTVKLNHEQAQVERLDAAGNVLSPVHESAKGAQQRGRPASILKKTGASSPPSGRRTLSSSRSILKNRRTDPD